MIRIRLSRGGKKNQPFYRIVAIEKSRKRDGKALDVLGFYNPVKNKLQVDSEKLTLWLGKGAQLSVAVKKLIERK